MYIVVITYRSVVMVTLVQNFIICIKIVHGLHRIYSLDMVEKTSYSVIKGRVDPYLLMLEEQYKLLLC